MGSYLELALRGPLAAIIPHHEGLTALRRDLHANPEIGFEEQRPGCYVRLGQGGGPSSCFLHNTRYDFNDAVIPLGSAFLAALAEHRMPLGRP